MILVDTSIWVDHFKQPVQVLEDLILAGQALGHPFVTGEVAVGSLREWDETVGALNALIQAKVAAHDEVLALIASARLAATGLGFVDVHLLASCRTSPGTLIWSRDKRLVEHAARLGVAWVET